MEMKKHNIEGITLFTCEGGEKLRGWDHKADQPWGK